MSPLVARIWREADVTLRRAHLMALARFRGDLDRYDLEMQVAESEYDAAVDRVRAWKTARSR